MGHWRAASLALALAAALVAAHPTESSRATPTRDAIAGSRRPRHSHRCGTHDAEPESLDSLATAVAAETLLRQRALVLERLRQMGVDIIEAPWDRIGYRLIDRYLEIKRAEAIG